MENLQKSFGHSIEQITRLRAEIELVQPGRIPRSESKAKRVVDQCKEDSK